MTPLQATPPSSLRIYFRLLSYVRPYVGTFAVSILGFMIFASSQPMLAGVMKYFVDGLGDAPAGLQLGVPFSCGRQPLGFPTESAA